MVGKVVVGVGLHECDQVGDGLEGIQILILAQERLPFVALVSPAWSPQCVQVALGQREPDRHDVSSHGAQPNDDTWRTSTVTRLAAFAAAGRSVKNPPRPSLDPSRMTENMHAPQRIMRRQLWLVALAALALAGCSSSAGSTNAASDSPAPSPMSAPTVTVTATPAQAPAPAPAPVTVTVAPAPAPAPTVVQAAANGP